MKERKRSGWGNEKDVRVRVRDLKERKKEMEREKIGWGNEKD